MSVEAFDLAQRLHAAATGAASTRCRYAPVLPPTDPVAITLTGSGTAALLRVTTASGTSTGHGHQALDALADVGVGLGLSHRTLVVADRSTLVALSALARVSARAGISTEQAAVIGWWEQRADHPGTGAVLIVTEAARLRWCLGVVPERERDVSTWRAWLGVADPGPSGLRDLALLVSGGHTLPQLLEMHAADTRSWEYHRKRGQAGHPWQQPDSRIEAALGLATRSDAAELYESLRLADPLVALRESFTGTVVTGTVTAIERHRVELHADRMLCRLRPEAQVQGWKGRVQEVPKDVRLSSGRVDTVTVSPDRQLVITVRDTILRPGPAALKVGDLLTLRPRAVDPRQQTRGRTRTRSQYLRTGNWLARTTAPTARRRDVPLDVAISAADQ
jgi:hypothetical protein